MARKASGTKAAGGATPKASATKATKKGATTKKAAGSVATGMAAKTGTPKGVAKKSAGAKAGAATKKASKPAVKLNDRQSELLSKVRGAGETGYHFGQKTELRTLEALRERKLLKRGAKDKDKGTHPYTVTKAGEKHLGGGGGSSGGGASPTS